MDALTLKIRTLEKELERQRKIAKNLRKYKFQVVEMKSQIRTLIKHKNAAPPKIANLFQFLRNNDYDAYLHLEKMLLPFSHENRMCVIHKSIRQPDWVIKAHESSWKFETPSRDWLRLVRNPHINYKLVNKVPDRPINIHGVMIKSHGTANWTANTSGEKLEIIETKDELFKKLKDLGVDVKTSWTKGKMYQKLMELDEDEDDYSHIECYECGICGCRHSEYDPCGTHVPDE